MDFENVVFIRDLS